jgi:Protein of unknown function (DUF3891)
MIIRKETNGELTLIPQTDHSRFVGQLAAHWGNQDFAPVEPFESIVRAATFHDYGYVNWEPDPDVDESTGEPYQFRGLPFSMRQLDAYQWCIDWLSAIDPYSGVLVSRHRTGLWKARYGTITYPTAFNPPNLHPEISAFIERNENWQAEALPSDAQPTFQTNYRLLQTWDLLGLYFGCQEPCDDYIEPVPTTYAADDAGVKMTMRPAGDRHVVFEPYPFDKRGLKVQIASRRVPQASFESTAAFRRAFYQAEQSLLEYTLE